jgi:glycosyltransferase involved in cell wall biosynthesis
LIFVGRISPEKRPEVAIEVARAAKLPLVMVIKRSEPAERAYFDEIVAPLLGDDVTVLDQPPHEVKVDLLGRARALVFPIDWPEPFGLVMTEAMACGTPVITRPLGAASEIVANGITGSSVPRRARWSTPWRPPPSSGPRTAEPVSHSAFRRTPW